MREHINLQINFWLNNPKSPKVVEHQPQPLVFSKKIIIFLITGKKPITPEYLWHLQTGVI